MADSPSSKQSIKARLATEFKHYWIVTAYLFICFSVLLAYQASHTPGVQDKVLVLLGAALAKALVLGKFIMIGEALGAGTRVHAPTLMHRVAWRSAGVVVVLALLKLGEEWVVGVTHGQSTGELVEELTAQPWLALLAPVLMMLLILIPLITASEISRALGADELKRLLLGSSE